MTCPVRGDVTLDCAAGRFVLRRHDPPMRALSRDILAAAGEPDIWREHDAPMTRRWHDAAIVSHAGSELAGSIWLRDAEIAFIVAAPWRGRGLGRAAVRAFCADAFDRHGYAAIHAYVERDNAPSRRVVEGAGFRFCDLIQPGRGSRARCPLLYYRLLRGAPSG